KRCVEFPLGLAARTTPRDPHRDRGPRQLLLLLLLLLLMLILPLPLTLGGPPKRRSRRTRPAGRRTGMCGVFRGGRMPPRKIPPASRTRREASGAKAGCAFFAPGFFAQAKKGGSRRHGAKALDPKPLILMPAEQSTSGT